MHRVIAVILVIFSTATMLAQRPLKAAINATSDTISIAYAPIIEPVTPPEPPVPYNPPIIDGIEQHVAFTDDGQPSDPGTLFGKIPYETSLDAAGRMRVTIPLESYSSEYENTPALALVYDNATRVSPMGYGWSLAGLSQIRRSGKNFFTDGMTSGPSLSGYDFTLNGVRLLLQSDADGVHIYRTQTGNTKAILDSSGNFTVFNPDGSRDEFMDHDSLRYYVTRHVALDGQEIVYTYRQSVGHKVLSKVNYGDGRHMRFSYHPASSLDTYPVYAAGVEQKFCLKLDSVIVANGSRKLVSYGLLYKNNIDFDDPLRMVTLSDSSGHQCVPLRFSYHAAGETRFSQSRKQLTKYFECSGGDMSKIIVTRGRFDYGCEDDGLLMYPNRVPYRRNHGIIQAPYSNQYLTGDSIIATTKMHFSNKQIFCGSLPAGEGFVEALAMDVDGYKGDELVRINNVSNNGIDSVIVNVFDTRYGLSFRQAGKTVYRQPAISQYGRASVRPKSFIPGDFNGDGRTDLLIISHSNPSSGVRYGNVAFVDFSDSIPRNTSCQFILDSCYLDCPAWSGANPGTDVLWQCYNNSDRLVVLDVEGCGTHQLGVVNDGGMNLYSFRAGHNGQFSMWVRKAGIALTRADLQDSELTTGDFNGDGITDLAVLQQRGSANHKIFLGQGDGNFILEENYFYITHSDRNHYAVTDVDRDGKSDIFVQPPYSGGTRQVFMSGNWWRVQDIPVPGGSYTTGCNTYDDGHNYSLVSVGNDGEVTFHRYNDPADVRNTLAQVTDSVGQTHTFTHRRLYRYDDTPFPAYAYHFPFNTFADGTLVCAGHRVETATDTISNVAFGYTFQVMHRQGLGFCGFEHVASLDSVSGNCTDIYNEPLILGATRETRLNNGSTQLNRSCSDNSLVIDAADKHISIRENSRISTDYATHVTDSATFTYDGFNNIIQERHTLTGNISRDIDYERLNRDTADVSSSTPYIIGLETRREETVNANGRSVTAGHRTTYDENGMIYAESDYRGTESNAILRRTFTRDNLNRITQVATTSYSGTPVKRHLTYSGNGRRPKSVTDEKGIISTYTWGDFGVLYLSQMPDLSIHEWEPGQGGGFIHNGTGNGLNSLEGGQAGGRPGALDPEWPTLNTRFHYSTLGQLDSVTSPQGVGTRIIRQWLQPNEIKAMSVTEVRTDGQPVNRVWHDALGRCVRSGTQRFDGSWLTTDTVYDARGRVARVSLPWRTNERHWTEFCYDRYDRPIEVTYPDGHSDVTVYCGLQSTSTVDGVTTSRTVNALGLPTTGTDATGTTIEYDLYPDGQPAAISVGQAASTTFEYDAYGRPTAINDPSAGRREKQYDADGNVARETDARGSWVAATHNSRRQPVTCTTSDGQVTTFTYDNWGSPTAMTDNSGHSSTWTYDNLRRLQKESVDGYSRTFAYDSLSRVRQVTHALADSTICTEQNSYAGGTLSGIALAGGAPVWNLVSECDNGLPGVTTGGVLWRQTLSYDMRGNVVSRQVNNGQIRPLPKQTYTYDTATGNMSARTLFGRQELFGYDGLNRLTGDGARSFAYDDLGNLTARGGAGTLSYIGTAPYAATFLDPGATDAMVPLREQRISFNAMQLPDSISENGMTASFSYRGDGNRASMVVTDAEGDTVRTAGYRDRLETWRRVTGGEMQEKSVLWLGGTPYDAPAALVRDYGSSTWALHRVLRDNQGSIVTVASATGSVRQSMAYDAWGALRNPSTGEAYAPDAQPELLLGRGYTGHEHLPEFGLINMNARLYDPALGRFLNPDPEVQLPDNTQSYNRYTYCLNNPLRYADPTGMKWLMSKFGNEYFLFYDSRVNDLMQLQENYGFNSDISILDDDITVIIRDKETGETLNEFDLHPNGDFTMDGVNQTQEYNNNGLLHIGSTNYTNSKTISKNFHGSYLGPHNPMLKDNKGYSYAVPPQDLHDYFAFQHDQGYDLVGANGTFDALFNTNTLDADWLLASRMSYSTSVNHSYWGYSTSALFYLISYFKFYAKYFQ